MKRYSICDKLQVVPGGIEDYKQLARYHYRHSRPGPCKAVFVLKSDGTLAGLPHETPVGVIVYSTATAVLELRNAATNHFFAGLDRDTQLGLINKHIRRISRLVIEPRFRGLGLAARLVRETMPQLNVPIIEAVAVMGRVNPFLEKAGMKAYKARLRVASVQLAEAFNLLGLEDADLVDVQKVQRKLDSLSDAQSQFLEKCIRQFLKSHGRRRDMPAGLERTGYILGALSARPTYYIWFNPKFDAGWLRSDDRAKLRKEAC